MFLGPAKEDGANIAIVFLFSTTFYRPASRDSCLVMGVFSSFEKVLTQKEVSRPELPFYGPTPFEERLAEVEAFFGECLTTTLVSPPELLGRTPPSFPVVPISTGLDIPPISPLTVAMEVTPIGAEELSPPEIVEPCLEEVMEPTFSKVSTSSSILEPTLPLVPELGIQTVTGMNSSPTSEPIPSMVPEVIPPPSVSQVFVSCTICLDLPPPLFYVSDVVLLICFKNLRSFKPRLFLHATKMLY